MTIEQINFIRAIVLRQVRRRAVPVPELHVQPGQSPRNGNRISSPERMQRCLISIPIMTAWCATCER